MPPDNLSWRRDFYILALYLLFVNTFLKKFLRLFYFFANSTKAMQRDTQLFVFFCGKAVYFQRKI